MKLIKKYNNIIYFILFVLLLTLIQTIINLIFNISIVLNQLISYIPLLIYVFITSYIKSINTKEKGLVIGLKTGITYIAILYILGITTLTFKLPLKRIIYFISIILLSILSSIIGKNKKL